MRQVDLAADEAEGSEDGLLLRHLFAVGRAQVTSVEPLLELLRREIPDGNRVREVEAS